MLADLKALDQLYKLRNFFQNDTRSLLRVQQVYVMSFPTTSGSVEVNSECRGNLGGCRGNLGGCRGNQRGVPLSVLSHRFASDDYESWFNQSFFSHVIFSYLISNYSSYEFKAFQCPFFWQFEEANCWYRCLRFHLLVRWSRWETFHQLSKGIGTSRTYHLTMWVPTLLRGFTLPVSHCHSRRQNRSSYSWPF